MDHAQVHLRSPARHAGEDEPARCRSSCSGASPASRPSSISGNPENFGLPKPNHRFLEAHPTVSSEFLLRLGSGDATAKPDVAELLGDKVRFADGSIEQIDVIIYATGYNITFPFFDPDFISAPDNKLHLYKRMFMPGMDDLVFIGLAQAIPTLFPFVELQGRLLAEYLSGDVGAPVESRNGARAFATTRRSSSSTTRTGPGTPCRSTSTSTSTTSRSACCPKGRRRARRRRCVTPRSCALNRYGVARPGHHPTSWDREPLHPGLRHRTQSPPRHLRTQSWPGRPPVAADADAPAGTTGRKSGLTADQRLGLRPRRRRLPGLRLERRTPPAAGLGAEHGGETQRWRSRSACAR